MTARKEYYYVRMGGLHGYTHWPVAARCLQLNFSPAKICNFIDRHLIETCLYRFRMLEGYTVMACSNGRAGHWRIFKMKVDLKHQKTTSDQLLMGCAKELLENQSL